MDQEKRDQLIAQARKNDRAALDALIREYYPYVYRFFYYRTAVKEDAEDLSSEVFMRVIRAMKRQRGRFLPWLYRISRNILIDYYRKRSRIKQIPLHEVEPYIQDMHVPEPELSADDIRKMTASLTGEQREVILLKFIEGLSNSDIARIMNKTVEAVKGLQFRALTVLRTRYKDRIRGG